jgi:glycosidase
MPLEQKGMFVCAEAGSCTDCSPRLHEFIQEMNREVLSQYDLITVGELNHVNVDQMLRFSHPDRREIQMGFTFEHVNLGRGGIDRALVEPHKLSDLKKVLANWQTIRDRGGWHALYLENHDQVSTVHHFDFVWPILMGQASKHIHLWERLTRVARSVWADTCDDAYNFVWDALHSSRSGDRNDQST